MDALHLASATVPTVTEVALPFEVRPTATGRGLFAGRAIEAGTPLFGEDDWVDEAERRSFSTMSAGKFQHLPPAVRAAFLRVAYKHAPEQNTGTFHPEAVRHPVNFINHSCD